MEELLLVLPPRSCDQGGRERLGQPNFGPAIRADYCWFCHRLPLFAHLHNVDVHWNSALRLRKASPLHRRCIDGNRAALSQRRLPRARSRFDLQFDFDARAKAIDDPNQAIKREASEVGIADA